MLVATSELEMARMRALWERTAANGLEREWLSAAELREREPNIIGLGGILSLPAGLSAIAMSRRPWRTAFRPKAARSSTMPRSAR
ncbi:hydroxyglutarate oxidase [Salmonella enterica subsp. enterica serovar Choleraesuis str. 0006]|nr:hydroxyglutarate oxidase [Salmonella enterica subsp. enterica serovar Choleraesuis str. 0006]